MSDLSYEFLTYEAFPNDQYVKEVVEVCLGGGVILPFQHIKMKDGGSFWSFCGCQATKGDGMKKRFNADFETKSFKRKFEADLEVFVKSRSAYSPTSVVSTSGPQTTEFGTSQTSGGVNDGNLPF